MDESIAVVIGLGPTGLSIARGLGRKGVKVYGISLSNLEVANNSRYCVKICTVDPRRNPDLMCRNLVKFAEQHANPKKVLYPSGDEAVAFMSEHDELLKKYYLYNDLSRDIADTFLSKKAFYNLCNDAGVPTVQSFFVKDFDEATALVDSLPFPCFLKPIYYHVWATEFGLRKGFLCRDKQEYTKNLRKVRHVINNIVIQEVVDGLEDNLRMFIAYMDRQGRPHGIFTGRKLRQYPPGFGTGCAILSSPEPEIIGSSVRLLRRAGYHGMAEVEYKWCERESVYKVIEVNIRPVRLGGLVEASGVNPLYLSFLDLTGQKLESTQQQQVYGIKWLFLFRDIPVILRGLISRRLTLSGIVYSFQKPNTWCIWARDDTKPFFTYFAEIVSKSIRMWWRRLKVVFPSLRERHNGGAH